MFVFSLILYYGVYLDLEYQIYVTAVLEIRKIYNFIIYQLLLGRLRLQ
jgi:hypothetical protein